MMIVSYAQGLIAQYHTTPGNTKLIVWLSGAPSMPSDSSSDAAFLTGYGYDMIRPDYYGFGRSGGFFSPKNCIQTAYDTIQTFRQMISVFSVYDKQEIVPPLYEEIVVVGFSYGGWIASMMPKFDPLIQDVVLIAPWLAYEDMAMLDKPEESDEEFVRSYSLVYKHLYRVDPQQDPYDALLDIKSVFPMQDWEHLRDSKVFVVHGSGDKVIWSGRSEQFIKQLLAINPIGNYKYVEYYGLGHGNCKIPGLSAWMYWNNSL